MWNWVNGEGERSERVSVPLVYWSACWVGLSPAGATGDNQRVKRAKGKAVTGYISVWRQGLRPCGMILGRARNNFAYGRMLV